MWQRACSECTCGRAKPPKSQYVVTITDDDYSRLAGSKNYWNTKLKNQPKKPPNNNGAPTSQTKRKANTIPERNIPNGSFSTVVKLRRKLSSSNCQ